MEELNCVNCGEVFVGRLNKNRPNKYCSMACYNKCKKGPSLFWDNATEEQIFERVSYYFEKKVIRREGCWDFKGGRATGGYGLISINGNNKAASRISWILHNGPVPEGLFVLHKCDNPPCTNPEHLFLGTTKDNAVDRSSKGRNRDQFGENNCSAVLTREKVLKIREMCQSGVSYNNICSEFGIAKPTISNIKSLKTWRNV